MQLCVYEKPLEGMFASAPLTNSKISRCLQNWNTSLFSCFRTTSLFNGQKIVSAFSCYFFQYLLGPYNTPTTHCRHKGVFLYTLTSSSSPFTTYQSQKGLCSGQTKLFFIPPIYHYKLLLLHLNSIPTLRLSSNGFLFVFNSIFLDGYSIYCVY